MNVTDYQEIWQIDAGGEIYEAKFEEMAQWIFDGSLLPQDMVKRRNLRWIEARKVPALMQFFNAKEQGLPPPVFTTTTDAQGGVHDQGTAQSFPETPASTSNPFHANVVQSSQNPFASADQQNYQNQNPWQESHPSQSAPSFSETVSHFNEPVSSEFDLPAADFCTMHPDAPTAFLCGTCGSGFCKACPKSYGGTVKICPFCGAMCKSVKEVQEKTNAAFQYEQDISNGFGADDFFKALAYPFKFKTSLFVGAVMFALFTIGQGAGSMGSIFLVGSGLVCWMMSNMLTFGVLANTVENFAQGRIGGNFMPSFDDFSLWDDVVHPFFLSIGVYLVSFGLIIVIMIGTIIWGLNQVSTAITDSYQPENAKLLDPDGPINGNPSFQKQNDIYGDSEMPDEDEIEGLQSKPGDTEEDVRRANELINNYRKKQAESIVGKAPETEEAERRQFYQNLTNAPVLIAILLLVGFGWGIFYLPVACIVASYTRSFAATLNPSIGLETIRLLGVNYFKTWFMGFALLVAYFILGFVLHLILSPLNLPTFGNLPAKVITSMFFFYFSVVYSVILGFLLYKNADKMNLFKG